MNRANLRSIVRNTYAVTENCLQQDFTTEQLAQKWVSDLIYIKIGEGVLYLAAVIDLADRKVSGWALSETMKTVDTAIAALECP